MMISRSFQPLALVLVVSVILWANLLNSVSLTSKSKVDLWSNRLIFPEHQGRSLRQHDPKAAAGSLPRDLSVRFEPNQGQSDPRVKFLCRGAALDAFFAEDQQVFVVSRSASSNGSSGDSITRKPAVLHMKAVGANPAPHLVALDQLQGKKNYLSGGNSQLWHANIPTFAKVKYEDIYAGIDLTFYGKGPQLEYDFTVAAGSQPNQIKLKFPGTRGVVVNDQGELIVRTGDGELRHGQPTAYQEIDGLRHFIPARYTFRANHTIGFKIGQYDITKPLMIDPLVYSTYLGGSNSELSHAIAVDSNGNAYVVGETGSSDFPTENPLPGPHFGGSSVDVFISKFDESGSLVYSTYLGGGRTDIGWSIAVDSAGQAAVTGQTNSFDDPGTGQTNESFPTTTGAYQTALPHQDVGSAYTAAFVTRLSADGDTLEYSTFLGGMGDSANNYPGEKGRAIAVDADGNMYVTGTAASPNFPTTSGAYQASQRPAFLSKINSSSLVYSTYYGGSGNDQPKGIGVDSNGYAVVTGTTNSSDFPTTSGARAFNSNSLTDPFVTKFNATGTGLLYSTNVGGSNNDNSYGVAVDANGLAFVTGRTESGNLPTTSSAIRQNFTRTTENPSDAFIVALNSSGSITYCTYLGGSSSENCQDASGSDSRCGGIALDDVGHIYVTGNTQSSDFDYSCPTEENCPENAGNIFITTLTRTFSLYSSSRYYDGSSHSTPVGIGANPDGTGCVITGFTSAADFPTVNAFQSSNAGNRDVFVMKVDDTAHLNFLCFCQGIYYSSPGECECAHEGPGDGN